MNEPRLISWNIVGFTVVLSYSDGDNFSIYKSDFDRAFGPIVSGSKSDIHRDFAIFNK